MTISSRPAFRSTWILAIVTMSIINAAGSARADNTVYNYGEVIAVHGCPQIYVIDGKNGFSIVEVVGGAQINERDILGGKLERVGLVDVIDITRNNQQNQVIVEASLLSQTEYRIRLRQYCHG